MPVYWPVIQLMWTKGRHVAAEMLDRTGHERNLYIVHYGSRSYTEGADIVSESNRL